MEMDEVAIGTQIQALPIDNIRGNDNYIASFKDAQQVVRNGYSEVWGQIVDPPVNKNRADLGFSMKNDKGKNMKLKSAASKYHDIFRSGINAIMEDEAKP